MKMLLVFILYYKVARQTWFQICLGLSPSVELEQIEGGWFRSQVCERVSWP